MSQVQSEATMSKERVQSFKRHDSTDLFLFIRCEIQELGCEV